MGKGRKRQIGWYDLKPMLKYNAGTVAIWGERSNGKTYAVKTRIAEKLEENIDNNMFIYIRRRQRQISRRLMRRVFEDCEELYEKKFGDIMHYTADRGFYMEINGELKTVGWAMSVEEGATGKGISWNKVSTIMFEEFLEYDGEIEDEISKYMNIVSTVTRRREDCEVFMTANTIGGGKLSPYFKMMGINPLKVKQGQRGYIKHENGATIAFHRTGTMSIKEDGTTVKNKFVGFDNNPTTNMMLFGEWEYAVLNIKDVDGIGWKEKRKLLPFYITGMGECFELSLYESIYPILFIRKVNNQLGIVREDIRFNLSYDGLTILTNKRGRVPMFGKVNKLVDDECMMYWETVRLCIEAQRVVFDNMENGSDFLNMLPHLI